MLSDLAVTHVLAFIGALLTTAKLLSASFCHFYVAINQQGLFARSVRGDRSSLIHALCLPALCDAGGGVSHDDTTADNPICKECITPAGLKVFMNTHIHEFYRQTGSCLSGLRAWH